MLKLISKNGVTNYNIKLEDCKKYGELIKKIVSTLNSYIYAIQFIEIFMKKINEETEECVIEIINVGTDVLLSDKFKYKNIIEIKVYEREKNNEGKIKDSILVNKYINYRREIADHDMAIQMQNQYNYSRVTSQMIGSRLQPSNPPTYDESIEDDSDDSDGYDDMPGLVDDDMPELEPEIPINNSRTNLHTFLNNILSNEVFNVEHINDIGDDESINNEQLNQGQENITNLINSESFRTEIRNTILHGLLAGPGSTVQEPHSELIEPQNSNFIGNLLAGPPPPWQYILDQQQQQSQGQVEQPVNQEDVKVVLKESDFNQLPIKKYSEVKNNSNYLKITKCSLTLENFKDNDDIVILPCQHYFSMGVKDWLTQHSHKCIICRAESGKGTPLL